MDLEIKVFKNKKGEVSEGIFAADKLIYTLSGFAQIRRGIIAHAKELGDRLGWLYVVLILLAKPLGKDKGTLEISLKILSQIMGKSLSQISRDLSDLARHKNHYIIYQKAKGRYSRAAKIIIPKYPVNNSVDKPVNSSFNYCKDSEVNCMDAEVEGSTAGRNAQVHCINAEVGMNNPNKIKDLSLTNNRLITEKTKKSLITVGGHFCGKVLSLITLSAFMEFDLTVDSQRLELAVKEYCEIRKLRNWCHNPENCFMQVYNIIEKISMYEINDHPAYFKKALKNFLNENADELKSYTKEGKDGAF
ncbi:MAG: hypothetical protein ABIH08_03610 [Candidatus Omnitrophota bacterium]